METLRQFDWRAGPPLSHVAAPIVGGCCYALVMSLWRSRVANQARTEAATTQDGQAAVQQTKKRTGWSYAIALHNACLCIASLIMLLGFASSAYERTTGVEGGSMEWLLCESPSTTPTGALFAWTYMYYLSKYWEFGDTVLALAKGSVPRHFVLHVFHHSFVGLMAWLWLETTQSLHTIGAMFNCLVHVFMYYYFCMSSLGHRVWWKRYITVLQNIQFMTSLVLLLGTLYLMKQGRTCAGMGAMAFNLVFNVLLLSQFWRVLFPGKKKTKTT